ncbi:CpsB/CapC family capsule biosynthesis tyrosine phosphatase, partial [Bacteroides cellulosilyticus]
MWPFSKSQPVAASGILCEMTDYHSHILPGVDDGVKTMNESLQILAEMKHQGVRKVWFTPHIMEDIPNTNAGLRERFQELKEKFRKPEDAYCGTVELNLAAEYMMDNLFAERLEADDLLPIYEGGYRYLLVETTGFTPPMNLLPVLK